MFFDDYSDNSYGKDHDDEYDVMRMIERNDPTLTELHGYLPPADGWEEFGRAIGKNTHLKEIAFLGFDNDGVDRDVIPSKDFLNFLLVFALNRSIQKLIFACWDLPDADWRILIRFFNDNQASESLEVEDYDDGRSLSALASALQRFDSLKEFRYCCGDSYVECDSVIEALIGHSGLRKMSLLGVRIGRRGCAALGARLLNSRSNLSALNVQRVEMEDDGEIIFANGLSDNSSLKELALGRSEITELGWQAIFAALQRSSCRLEKLDVNGNSMNDDLSHSMSCALLRHNATIKTLHLGNHMHEDDMRNANWSALFRPLQDNTSALEKLTLNSDSITNEGVDALTNVRYNVIGF